MNEKVNYPEPEPKCPSDKATGTQTSGRAVKPPPNLVYINSLKSQDSRKYIVRGIKCKCGKSWCRVCSIKTVIKRFYEHVKDWDWQCVRELILTVDRDKFDSPEQASDFLSKNKRIAGLIRNLERTQDVVILDWCRLLEWHRDGYPHWHLFILVDKAGHSGQIGFRKVLPYWEYGRVEEQYIHNQGHWDHLVGYFKKHGYFEKKKGHQARLPEWARERNKVIKRFTRKNRIKNENEKEDSIIDFVKKEFKEMINCKSLCDWFEKKALEKHTKNEGQKLDLCGTETNIYIGPFGFKLFGRINIPYNEFKKIGGNYVEKLGHVIEMNWVEFELFIAKCKFCYNLK